MIQSKIFIQNFLNDAREESEKIMHSIIAGEYNTDNPFQEVIRSYIEAWEDASTETKRRFAKIFLDACPILEKCMEPESFLFVITEDMEYLKELVQYFIDNDSKESE